MSIAHQKSSIENQLDIIRKYAAAQGIRILRTFEDFAQSQLDVAAQNLETILGDLVQAISVVKLGMATWKSGHNRATKMMRAI